MLFHTLFWALDNSSEFMDKSPTSLSIYCIGEDIY